MTVTAALILIVSAFMHAGWNLIGKRENPTISFFFAAALIGAFFLFPFVVAYPSVVRYIPQRVWAMLFGTGLFQAIYFTGLAGAYRKGDMSVAYPMARSVPVILVALISMSLGRGEQLSSLSLGGIVLIMIGGFILPMRCFKDFRWYNYVNPSNLFALMAALGTAGYSLIDDEALRMLRSIPEIAYHSWKITAVYAFFEGLTTSAWLGIVISLQKRSRRALRDVFRSSLPTAFLTGAVIYVTYTLVLISMAFVKDVSYVVAFRQLSLPIGVLLGVLILKESAHIPKFLGVTIMFAGLTLVGLG